MKGIIFTGARVVGYSLNGMGIKCEGIVTNITRWTHTTGEYRVRWDDFGDGSCLCDVDWGDGTTSTAIKTGSIELVGWGC